MLFASYLLFYSDPEDGGNTLLRNIDEVLTDYAASHCRR
jgi:hypothetical protein